jgi:hypothetical protein
MNVVLGSTGLRRVIQLKFSQCTATNRGSTTMSQISLQNSISSSSTSMSGSSGRTRVDPFYISEPHKSAEEMANSLISDLPSSQASTSISIHSDPDSLVGSSQGSKYEMCRSKIHCPNSFHSRPTPLELQFTMKSVGRNHHTDIALTDVIKVSNYLCILAFGSHLGTVATVAGAGYIFEGPLILIQ